MISYMSDNVAKYRVGVPYWHYSGVTWASIRLKQPATRKFIQYVQANKNNNENIKIAY